MDAAYTPVRLAGSARGRTRLGRLVRSASSIVAEVLAESARGDDFERAFRGAPGAQFAALPEPSKQRLLDRGVRP